MNDVQVPAGANFKEFNVTDISEIIPRSGTDLMREARVERNEQARILAEEAGEDVNVPLEDDPAVQDRVEVKHYMHLGVEDVCSTRSPGKATGRRTAPFSDKCTHCCLIFLCFH